MTISCVLCEGPSNGGHEYGDWLEDGVRQGTHLLKERITDEHRQVSKTAVKSGREAMTTHSLGSLLFPSFYGNFFLQLQQHPITEHFTALLYYFIILSPTPLT